MIKMNLKSGVEESKGGFSKTQKVEIALTAVAALVLIVFMF